MRISLRQVKELPKISVILPVYNCEKYLEKCLDSVFFQSFSDFEVIAVNDGSTDSSAQILERYRQRFGEKLTCLTQENAGQAAARNKGMQYARGEFVAFVDSDDYIAPNTLELCYAYAAQNALDVVCFGFFSDRGGKATPIDYIRFPGLPPLLTYVLSEASPCNKLIRRSVWVENGIRFTEGIIYEDFEIIPTLALYTDKIGYLEQRLYYYVIHENSTMHQPAYNKKLQSIFMVMESLSRRFAHTQYQNELEYLYIAHLLHDAVLRFLCFREGKGDILKISAIMRKKYPHWRRNTYYKHLDWKYKVVCTLAYYKQIRLLKLVLGV